LEQGGGMAELSPDARHQLRAIHGFLSMYADIDNTLPHVVEAFWRRDDGKDWRQVAPRVHLITRIYFSGSYLRLGDADLHDSFGQKAWSDWCHDESQAGPNPRSGRRYFPLLGVPDIISIQADRPMCRCPLPQFFTERFDPNGSSDDKENRPSNEQENEDRQKPYRERRPDLEQFPNFFARRELALPLFLEKPSHPEAGDGQIAPEAPKDILGVLSVTLKQRDLRLFLVHRLVRAVSESERKVWEKVWETVREKETAGADEEQVCGRLPIDALGPLFKSGDLLLLGEGWGDLLILLKKPSDEEMESRMRDAFHMERILFQDFQVDRAELALSPDCVAVALGSDDFSVSAGLRFMEDRGISFNATDWQERVQNRLKERTKPGAYRGWDNACEVWRPAGGRFHLVVRFVGNGGKGQRSARYEDIATVFARTEEGTEERREDDSQGRGARDVGFEFNTGLDFLETTIAMRCKTKE
jgi:hypothetical protein